MADAAKVGRPWDDDELDAIVEDYFGMLGHELAGRNYVKLAHSKTLMARIGRTHRSVEFKHQNISAVLEELGLPWISGYKPKKNYQNAIFGAIDRYLERNPATLEIPVAEPEKPANAHEVFVPPPAFEPSRPPEPLRRLIAKFDPVERDRRNRTLGKAGERFVLDVERTKLVWENRADLATKVRWIAEEEGDGAGYDVLSFDRSGVERLLEVKTTNGSARTPFFLTRNEMEVAAERSEHWRIYRVHLFAKSPRIFAIAPPVELACKLRPETWRAFF